MPTDKLEVKNIFITDLDTGQRTELKDVTDIKEDKVEYEPFISPREVSFEVEISLPKKLIAKGNLEDVAKEIFFGLPLEAKILDLEFMQNRIHNRKRINKKWAKRYGFTCTVVYE